MTPRIFRRRRRPGDRYKWTMEVGAVAGPTGRGDQQAPAQDVSLAGVRKAYGDVVAVDSVDLRIGRGEFFTLLGPSGSGKTTCLRMIGGFERPDAGTIELAGRDVTRLPPTERDVTPSSRTTRSSPI